MSETPAEPLQRTPLFALHVELGARMAPFAGYEMPVQYPAGIIAEHLHARAKAALFDVSHMGQVHIRGDGAAAALEALVPADVAGLGPGAMRYTMFTTEAGGILDDFMIANMAANAGTHLLAVVNAARKHDDLAHMRAHLGGLDVALDDDRALLALQGPAAAEVLARHAPASTALGFMEIAAMTIAGADAVVSRSGYTGEDGFEISVPVAAAEALARRLLAEPEVAPAGLGARDSLRLEAGLCLYGHDIDETTTPVEARLGWTIAKRRRAEGAFPGADVIRRELAEGPARRRVGLRPEGRAPARESTEVRAFDDSAIGVVTSGGYGPSVGGPVAMGYVARAHAAVDTEVRLLVRDRPRPARVVALPFVPHRYHRG